jgi:hypothetical protein
MTGKVLAVAAGIALAALASASAAKDPPVYRGQAEVVGPAMLSLGGKRIVLYGVDAPVKGQPCYAGSKVGDCSTASAKILLLIGTQEMALELALNHFAHWPICCIIASRRIGRHLSGHAT